MKTKWLAIATAGMIMAITPAFAQVRVSSSGRTENINKILPKNGLNRQDRTFMMDAAHINRGEVMLGELARQRGGTWGRQYGSDMVTEHNAALEELKTIARRKSVSLPGGMDRKHQAVHDKLSRLSGQAFDSAYRAVMIKGHGEAAMKLSTEIKRGHDSMVRNYAVTMLPSVKLHQKLAQQRKTLRNQ
jgi:putative membrane protein